jgi:hypothetical protein
MKTSTIAIVGLGALLTPMPSYADDLIGTAIAIPITPKMATPHGVYKLARCVADTGDKLTLAINTKLNSSALSTEGSSSHVPGTWSHVEQKGTTIFMPSSQTNMFIADSNSKLASRYILTDNQKTGKLTCDPFILVTFDREVSW